MHNTRLPAFSIAITTGGDIPRIIRRDDLLASLGMIHHRLVVREESIEEPVEDASSEERVDVANRKPV